MYTEQKLSILFYRKRKKQTSDGRIPLYVRITVDGLEDEFSSGIKVFYDDWDTVTQTVQATDAKYKDKNKRIGKIRTDLDRHYDLVKANHEIATPQLIKASNQRPVKAHRLKEEKMANMQFSAALDDLIREYVKHRKNKKKYLDQTRHPLPEKLQLFQQQDDELKKKVIEFAQHNRALFHMH